VALGGTSLRQADVDASTLDASTAIGFLVMASTFLMILFFLVRAGFNIVLVLLNAMFVFASSTATGQLLIVPALTTALEAVGPRGSAASYVSVPFCADLDNLCSPGRLSVVMLVGGGLALSASVGWFLHRHDEWMWLLQDAFSMAICCLFVRTVRLPSLKVGTLFLGMMFFYDVFMVFISPLLFHGESVMMTVATAGEPTAAVEHDTGKCIRTEGETMPMLMLIPRLNPFQEDLLDRVFSPAPPPPPPPPPGTPDVSGLWFRLSGAPGSFAMIGLGDLVRVPSLMATDFNDWARRHCTHASEQPSHPY